jgi:hypothetical protein
LQLFRALSRVAHPLLAVPQRDEIVTALSFE